MEVFLKDLKHSLQMFRQSPSFTLAAIAALALGIGANTAIFSVVNAVLLKPIPFPEPDRLVMFMNHSPQGDFAAASPAKFWHWRSQSTIQDSSAFRNTILNYTGGEIPEQLRATQVSVDYFKLFGVPVILGRAFSADLATSATGPSNCCLSLRSRRRAMHRSTTPSPYKTMAPTTA